MTVAGYHGALQSRPWRLELPRRHVGKLPAIQPKEERALTFWNAIHEGGWERRISSFVLTVLCENSNQYLWYVQVLGGEDVSDLPRGSEATLISAQYAAKSALIQLTDRIREELKK